MHRKGERKVDGKVDVFYIKVAIFHAAFWRDFPSPFSPKSMKIPGKVTGKLDGNLTKVITFSPEIVATFPSKMMKR